MGRAITASGPAITLTLGYARAGALMARQWSARCYGVARQREGSRQNSRRSRDNTNSRLRPRGGADGQAVVCPLLRGSSPTRGVAPKQQEGSRACSLSGISGWFSLSLYPLGAWVPKNLARRNFGLLVSAGPRLQAARWRGRRRRRRRFSFIDFRAPR